MAQVGLMVEQRGALAMTPALQQAIGFLALSNVDLSARLADLQGRNEALAQMIEAQPAQWLSLMRPVAPPKSAKGAVPAAPMGLGSVDHERLVQRDPGLIAHVADQLPLLVRRTSDRPIAEAFLMALEPSGWLGDSLEQIAAAARVSVDQARDVLRQLQGAEPTGLFARSLAECLQLQARELGLLTPSFQRLLDHLSLLAAGKHEELADLCGCDGDEVQAMARALRKLNPKPGAAYSGQAAPPVPPDLILQRDGDGWLIELNAATTPSLRISAKGAPPEAPPETLREAKMLIQALERRNATILSIASEIILRQDSHLRGLGAVSALTINDLASVTGLHRSTVSRVTAALVMKTPGRTLHLRALLCAAAPQSRQQEDALSVRAVLDRMTAIVAAEDKAKPLSDAAIAKVLLPEGAALARRTVAKYRALAGIPARSARRKA